MRGIFFRIWRYLNYPADTNGKVKETWLRMRVLSENHQIKFAAVESDLRYLKTMVVALQNQFNSIQEQLRASVPWFPLQETADLNPGLFMLVHLASFLQDPIAVDIGANESSLSEVLLDAGFQVYTLAPSPTLRVRESVRDEPGLHAVSVKVGPKDASLSSLAAQKEIPAHFSVLRTQTESSALEVLQGMGQLSPDIVETRFRRTELSGEREVATHGVAIGKELIQEMRARGYHWNLLIFRVDGVPAIRYVANLASVPDTCWGNLFFFRDFPLFEQAYRWSQAALPRFQHWN